MAEAQSAYLREQELDAALSEADWAVIKNLRDNGDDPENVREIDHLLYPIQEGTYNLSGIRLAISQAPGWRLEVLDNDRVQVFIMSQTYANDLELQIKFLVNAADAHGFEYDGWGTVAMTN